MPRTTKKKKPSEKAKTRKTTSKAASAKPRRSHHTKEPRDLRGAQKPDVYLYHHIHHSESPRGRVKQEIHHCPMFVNKSPTAPALEVGETRNGKELVHYLKTDKKPPKAVYDHLGNKFSVEKKQVGDRELPVITGLAPGQKVKWSDAEKGK